MTQAATLPPRPERPDCCAGGCATCVLDTYADELAAWEAQVETIQQQRIQQGLPLLPPAPQ